METLINDNRQLFESILKQTFKPNQIAFDIANQFVGLYKSEVDNIFESNDIYSLIRKEDWLVAKSAQRILALSSSVNVYERYFKDSLNDVKLVNTLGQFAGNVEISLFALNRYVSEPVSDVIKVHLLIQGFSNSEIGEKMDIGQFISDVQNSYQRLIIYNSIGSWGNSAISIIEKLLLAEKKNELKIELMKILMILGRVDIVHDFCVLSANVKKNEINSYITAVGHISNRVLIEVLLNFNTKLSRSAMLNSVLSCVFLGDKHLYKDLRNLMKLGGVQVYEQVLSVFELIVGIGWSNLKAENERIFDDFLNNIETNTRYFHGSKWSLTNLVDLLMRSYQYVEFLNNQIVSSTGVSFGFNHLRDLINNLNSIQLMNEWGEKNKNKFVDGEWFYNGKLC